MAERQGELNIVEALGEAGQVGNDLLSVDWALTPLGPPESWPRSLATIVRVVVTSRFSTWMAWGPELTFFCNDAYRRDTLGTKYPWALGRPAQEVWAEIWDDIRPRIETVLRTGVATWDESLLLFLERSGFVEEMYHTFSYSPLTDDSDAIAGMLCVVSENTESVVGERRMATLRDLGSETTAARDDRQYLNAACGTRGAQRSLAPVHARVSARRARSPGRARVLGGDRGRASGRADGDLARRCRRLLANRRCARLGSGVVESIEEKFEALPTGA